MEQTMQTGTNDSGFGDFCSRRCMREWVIGSMVRES